MRVCLVVRLKVIRTSHSCPVLCCQPILTHRHRLASAVAPLLPLLADQRQNQSGSATLIQTKISTDPGNLPKKTGHFFGFEQHLATFMSINRAPYDPVSRYVT